MNRLKISIVPLLALLIVGCGVLGMQKSQSFDDTWAHLQSQTTGLRDTSTRALDAHLITSAQMDYVISVADRSRTLLTVARTAYGNGDIPGAQRNLQLVTGVLDELERFLAESNQRKIP